MSQKDVSGPGTTGRQADAVKVRSHFGSSLEMTLCLLGDGTFRQLAAGTQKLLQSSREFHGMQNKKNRSCQESVELLSWLACGGCYDELRQIATRLGSIDFYEYAGMPTSLPHMSGVTVEHPLVCESQERAL